MKKWIDLGLNEKDIDKLLNEDQRQHIKWGIQQHDPYRWLAILVEEVGELAQAILKAEFENDITEKIEKEAIQVATLALKIAKMSKRKD